jgi:hypothetical protein
VCQSDCIVLEEVTMINSHLWNLMAKAALVCTQWICMGDFRQFGAIDSYCGCPVQVGLEESDILHQLCGARRLQLKENHRSDPELFAFYTSITEDLHHFLEQARQQFPLQTGVPRYSLSVSHAMRVYINAKYNEQQRREHPDAVQYKHSTSHEDNQPQSFWAWPGQELIGSGGRAKKGLFYTVQTADAKHIVLKAQDQILSLSAETCCKFLRLSHCITYASCQGLSLAGVRLLETDSPFFTWRHLYVGSSRCTSSRLLQVS